MCLNRVRIEWDKVDNAVNAVASGACTRQDVETFGKKIKVYSCGPKVIRVDIPAHPVAQEG